jgi:uncharacterized repeat protein (TIGR01451 family)
MSSDTHGNTSSGSFTVTITRNTPATADVFTTRQLQNLIATCVDGDQLILHAANYTPDSTLVVNCDMMITGPGAGSSYPGAIISGGGIDVGPCPTCAADVILINAGANVVMSNVSVRNSSPNGDGIHVQGMLDLENSDVQGNNGSGIFADTGSSVTIRNSTLAVNGVAGVGTFGAVSLFNDTIASNKFGVFTGTDGTISAVNTIIANNTQQDCNIPVNSSLKSFDRDGRCGLDLPSANPQLGGILPNGGSTQTMALLPNSPAINAGTNSPCPTVDQRYAPRARTITDPCDIGAYEFPQADLSITKTDSPDPVAVNTTLTYTVTVTNNGPAPATGVTVTDTLPAHVTFGSASSTVGTCTQAAGMVTCNVGNLASAASATITITVTPTATGSITNTARVTGTSSDPNNANNTATATTSVQVPADLQIVKTVEQGNPVLHGSVMNYKLAVTNNGPAQATNVVVTDTLPANVTFISVMASSPGSCSYTAATRTVRCTFSSIMAGPSKAKTVTIKVTPTQVGTLSNTATVTADQPDTNPGNNSSTVQSTVVPSADLSLTTTDSPDPVRRNNTLTYTLKLNNLGPDSAINARVTDTLPAGTTFVSATASQGTCTGTATVTCTLGTLASAATVTVTIKVTPTVTGTITNNASASSDTGDPDPGDNNASATTKVNS